jgi:hypothetical protein
MAISRDLCIDGAAAAAPQTVPLGNSQEYGCRHLWIIPAVTPENGAGTPPEGNLRCGGRARRPSEECRLYSFRTLK